jgi:mono/diheme cytochrome c family protein
MRINSIFTNKRATLVLAAIAMAMLQSACSNFTTRQPPVWVWDDMKKQDKYKAQAESQFYSDGRASRRPVEESVSQELYKADTPRATGIEENGTYVARNPLPLSKEVLLRGQQRFNIYCAPCHDRTGTGRGVVPAKVVWIPGNLHDARMVSMVDGELFHVATAGRRTMPGYRYQVSEDDRWAIVAYIRALQRASLATAADLPAGMQEPASNKELVK